MYKFKLHGCDRNPKHTLSVEYVAETEIDAFEQARSDARKFAGRWRIPVEIMQNGKAVELVWPM